MYKAENHWTLEEALGLIRNLQPQTRLYGYHLCVGGGVINKGMSKKDLDLFFLPLDNNRKGNPTGLMLWLVSMWGTCRDLKNGYETPEGSPYIYKAAFDYGGLRIDVFVITGLGGIDSEQDSKIFIREGDVLEGGLLGQMPIRRMDARVIVVPAQTVAARYQQAPHWYDEPVQAATPVQFYNLTADGQWITNLYAAPATTAVIDNIATTTNTTEGNTGGNNG